MKNIEPKITLDELKKLSVDSAQKINSDYLKRIENELVKPFNEYANIYFVGAIKYRLAKIQSSERTDWITKNRIRILNKLLSSKKQHLEKFNELTAGIAEKKLLVDDNLMSKYDIIKKAIRKSYDKNNIKIIWFSRAYKLVKYILLIAIFIYSLNLSERTTNINKHLELSDLFYQTFFFIIGILFLSPIEKMLQRTVYKEILHKQVNLISKIQSSIMDEINNKSSGFFLNFNPEDEFYKEQSKKEKGRDYLYIAIMTIPFGLLVFIDRIFIIPTLLIFIYTFFNKEIKKVVNKYQSIIND